MAEGYVIGVDLGGTKLLAGAVGADLTVIHRTNRLVYGLNQDELVQMIADAVDEIRSAVGDIHAIGFGIPCTFDSRSGMAVQAVNDPLKDIAFGELMADRLQMQVVVDNDAARAAQTDEAQTRLAGVVGASVNYSTPARKIRVEPVQNPIALHIALM